MKRKSITAFVLGLLGTLANIVALFYFFIVYVLASAFAGGPIVPMIIAILLMAAAIVLGIVACVFSFFKARISGILFSVSAGFILGLSIYFLASGGEALAIALYSMIGVFYVTALIFAFLAKPKEGQQEDYKLKEIK